jgi:hypothetical protein
MPIDEAVMDFPAIVGKDEPTGGVRKNRPERIDKPVLKAMGGSAIGYSLNQCVTGVDKAPPAKATVGFFKWGLKKLALLCKGKIASALTSIAASQALVVAVSVAVVVGIFVVGAMMVAS